MANKITDRFLKKYRDKDSQTQYYVRSTMIVSIILFFFMGIVAIFMENDVRLFLISGMGAFLLGLIFLRFGLFRVTGVILVVILSLLMGGIGFSVKYEHQNVVYTMGFLQIFIIFLTLLLSSDRVLPLLATIMGVCFVALYSVFEAIPNRMNIPQVGYPDLIINAVLIALAGGIVIGTNKRSKDNLYKISRQRKEQEEKAVELQALLQSLGEDFNTGDQLLEESNLMSENLDEINQQIIRLKSEMDSLSNGAQTVGKASLTISQSSKSLAEESDSQVAVVEQASAAVVEMSSSIENINRIARDRQKSIIDLAEKSRSAEEAINESEQSVEQLQQWVSSLGEVNSVINKISAQTGLLAMNAAIEAAHAGVAGKGFSVVADEVRKLAESSSKNVKMIAETLKQITAAIEHTSEINQGVSEAFHLIRTEIDRVAGGMNEIVSGIMELSEGTREINSGTEKSVESTTEVRRGVESVNRAVGEIGTEIDKQNEITSEIVKAVNLAADEIDKVRKGGHRIKEIGEKNVSNLKALEGKIREIG